MSFIGECHASRARLAVIMMSIRISGREKRECRESRENRLFDAFVAVKTGKGEHSHEI